MTLKAQIQLVGFWPLWRKCEGYRELFERRWDEFFAE